MLPNLVSMQIHIICWEHFNKILPPTVVSSGIQYDNSMKTMIVHILFYELDLILKYCEIGEIFFSSILLGT